MPGLILSVKWTDATSTMPLTLKKIAGTRVALGVGIGLLITDKFTDNE